MAYNTRPQSFKLALIILNLNLYSLSLDFGASEGGQAAVTSPMNLGITVLRQGIDWSQRNLELIFDFDLQRTGSSSTSAFLKPDAPLDLNLFLKP